MDRSTPISAGVHPASERFFRALDWKAFWTAFGLSFAVYFFTLAPTVTLEDSGELAVAGDYLGVPHPPGYPIWSLLSWIFSRLFFFVRFRGQPNPAWSIGLSSAVFGALACGLCAMLICRSGADMLRRSARIGSHTDRRTDNLLCWVGGVVCGLLFAFSPVMWSQSVIIEVYSLNAFFIVLLFLLVYVWMHTLSDKVLFAAAYVFGLGLTNYQVLLLALLALAVAVMLRDLNLFRDLVIVGAPYAVVLALIKFEFLPPIEHPTHPTCFVYMALNFALLVSAYFFLPRGRTVAVTVFLMQLGVAFYAYMPIVSELRNPPMNWGYPRTWTGFKHAISRGQYERIVPANVFSLRFIEQMGVYLTDLRMQFTLLAAPLAFLPFSAWRLTLRKRRVNVMYAAGVLIALGFVFAEIARFLPGAGNWAGKAFKACFMGSLAITVMGVVVLLVRQAMELLDKLRGKRVSTISERIVILLVFLAGLSLFARYVLTLGGNLSAITAPLRTAEAIAAVDLRRIVGQTLGIVCLMFLPVLLAGFAVWLMRGPAQLRLTIDRRAQKWQIVILFGFFTMSVVLIALANLKMDIQDTFIQRVKFISSHALYSFWIGYGLILGLALVDTLFKGNRPIKWAGIGLALALPLVPLHQNSFNEELIRTSGGAEQNGHDFGWQFGHYQLRGSKAILEELEADEEPLPNPSFPPAMTENAVFFGGTDPGRFVPTYMIYSARVREDVYLITQNALADNTYMSVMRDLYGDQIWIPAQIDTAHAFQRYVNEVRAGTRQAHADLRIEGGRVQVSGALGVMEINGILAEMIFQHNRWRHDFYVEESYVIRWMYPYLTPHGLIMRINREQVPLEASHSRADLDFWDWYTRRLISDRKFLRDVVARKSFSKLRSAIGGLYANRGKFSEAETAFREAGILYPLSPEANFRLVQEVMMGHRRFDEARLIIQEFARQDTNNARAPEFLAHLDRVDNLFGRIQTLEAQKATGKININEALELADAYRQANFMPHFVEMINSILSTPDLPPPFYFRAAVLLQQANLSAEMDRAIRVLMERLPEETPASIYLDIARLYSSARMYPEMGEVLVKYLERNPGDWKAWLDLAAIQIAMQNPGEATQSLRQAVATGGAEAVQTIGADARFAPMQQQVLERSRDLMGIPGAVPRP